MTSGASPVSPCKRLNINSAIRMPASNSSLSACHRASRIALSVLPSPSCHLRRPALRSVLRRTRTIDPPILLQLKYGPGDSFTFFSLGVHCRPRRVHVCLRSQAENEGWSSNIVPSSRSNVSHQPQQMLNTAFWTSSTTLGDDMVEQIDRGPGLHNLANTTGDSTRQCKKGDFTCQLDRPPDCGLMKPVVAMTWMIRSCICQSKC